MTDLRALDENLAKHLADCDRAALLVHLHALERELDARQCSLAAQLLRHAAECLAHATLVRIRWPS